MINIPVKNIEETPDEKEIRFKKLYDIYWQDHLKNLNYNKDINKMCEECIKDQIQKYNKQTIKCTGANTLDAYIDRKTREEDSTLTVEQLREYLPTEDVESLEGTIDPYMYMEHNCDIKRKGDPTRQFSQRWYQHMITRL